MAVIQLTYISEQIELTHLLYHGNIEQSVVGHGTRHLLHTSAVELAYTHGTAESRTVEHLFAVDPYTETVIEEEEEAVDEVEYLDEEELRREAQEETEE